MKKVANREAQRLGYSSAYQAFQSFMSLPNSMNNIMKVM